MNKTELIASVAEKAGMSKKDAERAVNAAIDTITAQLVAGDRVQLSGFGIFEVKQRQGRTGRNPRTGENVEIPSAKVPVFKPSKTLRDGVDK